MGQFTVYIDIVSNKYIASATIINSYNNYNIITQLLLQKKINGAVQSINVGKWSLRIQTAPVVCSISPPALELPSMFPVSLQSLELPSRSPGSLQSLELPSMSPVSLQSLELPSMSPAFPQPLELPLMFLASLISLASMSVFAVQWDSIMLQKLIMIVVYV